MYPMYPETLENILRENAPLAIAYSGGVDSRFLCSVAESIHVDILAFHIQGRHVPEEETRCAVTWAERHRIPLVCLDHPLFQGGAAISNSHDRCYICKKSLLQTVRSCLRGHGDARTICDGSNLDDGKVFRPGRRALEEEGILSPLQMAGLSKEMIRSLARENGLEDPDQPSGACLLTRFPYDVMIEQELLQAVGSAEQELRVLFRELRISVPFRLRILTCPVLQIQEDPRMHRGAIRAVLEAHGFSRTHIAVQNDISGFFDRNLPVPENLPLL